MRSSVRLFERVRRCRGFSWRSLVISGSLGVLAVAGFANPAAANCIAHQPANAQFTPPPDLQMTWDCVTGGPLYDHDRAWFIVTFKATNTDSRRIQAMKMQANFVDAFGDVLRTIPIIENASLGTGDSDGAVWAFHPTIDKNSLDHVAFFVLAAKYDDGSLWHYSGPQPKSGPTPSPRAALRRFPITGLHYDMGEVIAPSPSPSPSPTSTPW